MDLGRPVARHTIRRPHEVITLDPEQVEAPADEQPVVVADNDQQPAGSEPSDR
jgi:hypothetical protein